MWKLTPGSAVPPVCRQDTFEVRHDRDRAMEIAVGGQFDAVGQIEREILIHHGLQPDGLRDRCGLRIRTAGQASCAVLKGPYLGIHVVPELVEARAGGSRPGPTGASKSRQGSKFLKQTIVPMWSVSFRCSPTFSTSTRICI